MPRKIMGTGLAMLAIAMMSVLPVVAQEEGGSAATLLPDVYSGWNVGEYTITKMSMNQGGTVIETLTKNELADKTAKTVTMKTEAKVSTTFEIPGQGPQTIDTLSLSTVVLDFEASEMTITTETTSGGQKLPAQNNKAPIDASMYSKFDFGTREPIATEEITVPAGTFTCKVYEIDENGMKATAWVSSDVPMGGMVKTVSSGAETVLVEFGGKE